MNSFHSKAQVIYNSINGTGIIQMIALQRYIFPRKCITFIDSSIYKAEKLLRDNDLSR